MKNILCLFCLTMCSFTMFAQGNRLDLKGRVTDTLANPLPSATIMLLSPSDSTLLSFGRTNNDGTFQLSNVKRQPYLLKITFVGFIPYQKAILNNPDANGEMGLIQLTEIASQLMEVVIKAAKAPMSIRGDTIEYDATTFKVPPGSTVEDLLRRLPGIQVDANGSITSEGKGVNKVTVDGKRFFGTDPTAATKNLPAEGISKIQVFDEVKEEEKLTGIKSGQSDKTMNLELKEEFKKGGFGKVTAGIGTEDRAEIKGNYNKFNEKEQFSIIGAGNNTGRNGLSWNDYQDLRGSQSFNWNDDDADYGFNSGGGFRYSYFSNDDEEGDVSNAFFGSSNSGFPENYTGGLNYNYDHNKNKFSGLYFYNQKGVNAIARRNQQTFLENETFFNQDTSSSDRTNKNHRLELRFEKEIDSLNTIIVNTNGSYNNNFTASKGHLTYRRGDQSLSNEGIFDNKRNTDGWAFKAAAIYRHKFKKKGRSFGLSTEFSSNGSTAKSRQDAENRFYDNQSSLDSTTFLQQDIKQVAEKQMVKASTMYTEPIGKKFYWSTFYNFYKRSELLNRDVADFIQGEFQDNAFLSRDFDNTFTFNRLGTSFRYSYKGINVSLGAAGQQIHLQSDFTAGASTGISGQIDRKFVNYVPNFGINLDLKGNRYINAGYEVSIQEPSIRSLQPVIDNSNPLYIREGNPDLVPQIAHSFSGGIHQFNPATFINISANFSYSYYIDQFVAEQTVSDNFITTARTINQDGGSTIWSGLNFGFPIIKNKFTVNLNYGYSFSKNLSLINQIENISNTNRNRAGLRLNVTPNDIWSVYANANVSLAGTKYNINSAQNQKIYEQNYDITANTKLFWGLFFNSSFKVSIYQNDRFDFNQNIPILNLSLYKVVLKNDRGEIRFSLYDAFNQSRNISQNAGYNSVNQTTTETLGRYGMLSFTYNMKGVVASVKKKDEWGY
ncbi:MAG: outer membrane beta-barrel protein [Saprospiraceae bacterium]